MKNLNSSQRICIECNNKYTYLSKAQYDTSEDYTPTISHSKAYCWACHCRIRNETNLFELMIEIGGKENFTKIPTNQKILACLRLDSLPSDICIHCGKKVKTDKSFYYDHVTYFNTCDKRCQDDFVATQKKEQEEADKFIQDIGHDAGGPEIWANMSTEEQFYKVNDYEYRRAKTERQKEHFFKLAQAWKQRMEENRDR